MALFRCASGGSGGSQTKSAYNQSLPSNRTFNTGFEAERILITFFFSTNGMLTLFYDKAFAQANNNTLRRYYVAGSSQSTPDTIGIGDLTTTMTIESIDSSGFKLSSYCASSNVRCISYVATTSTE